MRGIVPGICIIAGLIGSRAEACEMRGSSHLSDIFVADYVASGFVEQYEINSQGYAEITVFINTVYFEQDGFGPVSYKITFTWRNSTFALPGDLSGGSYVFALLKPGALPAVMQPSGGSVIFTSPDPDKPDLLQWPCDPAFIFPQDSEGARAIAQIFDGEGDPVVEAAILGDFVRWGFNSPLRPADKTAG